MDSIAFVLSVKNYTWKHEKAHFPQFLRQRNLCKVTLGLPYVNTLESEHGEKHNTPFSSSPTRISQSVTNSENPTRIFALAAKTGKFISRSVRRYSEFCKML